MLICDVCDKEAKFICERCEQKKYCSPKCGSIDWKNNHYSECDKLIGRKLKRRKRGKQVKREGKVISQLEQAKTLLRRLLESDDSRQPGADQFGGPDDSGTEQAGLDDEGELDDEPGGSDDEDGLNGDQDDVDDEGGLDEQDGQDEFGSEGEEEDGGDQTERRGGRFSRFRKALDPRRLRFRSPVTRRSNAEIADRFLNLELIGVDVNTSTRIRKFISDIDVAIATWRRFEAKLESRAAKGKKRFTRSGRSKRRDARKTADPKGPRISGRKEGGKIKLGVAISRIRRVIKGLKLIRRRGGTREISTIREIERLLNRSIRTMKRSRALRRSRRGKSRRSRRQTRRRSERRSGQRSRRLRR